MDKFLTVCFDAKKLFLAGNCDPTDANAFACRTFCDEGVTEFPPTEAP